jgi:hypothetical protein
VIARIAPGLDTFLYPALDSDFGTYSFSYLCHAIDEQSVNRVRVPCFDCGSDSFSYLYHVIVEQDVIHEKSCGTDLMSCYCSLFRVIESAIHSSSQLQWPLVVEENKVVAGKS